MDRRMLGFAAMTILASSCFDGPDPAASSEGERSDDAATRPLRHELVGLRPVDGKYPILDIQDSPGGRRYSMEVGASKACNDCPVEIHEGVFERQMTRRPTAAAPARLLAPSPVISDEVARQIAREPEARHAVELLFRTQHEVNIPRQLERLIATGAVTTTQQLREAHRDIARRYDDERQAFIARKRSDVEAAGGRVLRAYPALGRIRAEMSGPEIDALLPELRRVDVAKVNGGSADNADMEFIREGHQLDQFIDNGFKGDRYPGGGDEYHMAFWEGGSDTPADMDMLYDGAALAVSRYLATLCFAAPCALANDASQHPNRVLSVAVGDLTQGQDSAVTDATEQINKSGIALEANASYYVGGWAAAAAQMLIDASLYEVAVANTAGGATGSPTCQGNDADAIAADQLFEAGLFVVGGAGNDGDSTECNVHQPKDAIGVFTTAGSEPGTNSAEGVRDATFHTSSSVGGVKGSFNNSGRGRTIIDMTFTFGFTDRPNWDGTSYGNSVGGNSLTGPAVAAAAVDFADWFETGYGSTSLLGQPGKLFAAMLLMGDRTVDAGRQLNQFDRKWGAGLLKMRKLDSTGLDEPWQWGLSSVCVGDGESIYFDLAPNLATSTDYDVIKGVLFWYDNRIENSQPISNLDLILEKSPDGVNWLTHRSSSTFFDNKERVFAHDGFDGEIGNQHWRWRVNGASVDETSAGDPSGCAASGEQRAHLAWLVEDSDRDDVDGPSDTEIEEEN